MRDRLVVVGWGMRELERRTGDSYANLRNWLGGKEKVPADFVARYVSAVPVNPLWILTGEGSMEPVTAGTPERLYDLVETVVAVKKAGLPPDDLNPLLEQVTAILRRALLEQGGGGDGGR